MRTARIVEEGAAYYHVISALLFCLSQRCWIGLKAIFESENQLSPLWRQTGEG